MRYNRHLDFFKSDTWAIFHKLDGNTVKCKWETLMVLMLVTVLVGWTRPKNTIRVWVEYFRNEDKKD